MAGPRPTTSPTRMEHGPLDFKELREFMRGLVDAGPTRTGHKTPAVIVTLPIAGTADALRADAWMIQQALAAGVHGILLCNAESPEAARLMIEAARYPFAPRVEGLAQGTRGNGSQATRRRMGRHAAGVHAHRRAVADEPRWRTPLRPQDREPARRRPTSKHRSASPESRSLMGSRRSRLLPAGPPRHLSRRRRNVARNGGSAAPRARGHQGRGVKFLNACTEHNVIDQLKDGVMICTGGDSPAADKGRAFTKRTDPW